MSNTFSKNEVERIINETYGTGFDEGYAAARLTVELVVKAWRQEPFAYDLEAALKALDMSKDKAKEMLGTPSYTVAAVCPSRPASGIWQ